MNINQQTKRIFLFILTGLLTAAFSVSSHVAFAENVIMDGSLEDGSAEAGFVWGVKSHDPVSGPPATLFKFTPAGALSPVGTVQLNNVSIDVDGLAMDHDGQLFGFKVSYPGGQSQLIQIDPNDATATTVGPVLTDRDIRGATFDSLGRLLVIDSQHDELLSIDPTNGQVLDVLFTLPPVSNLVDITQQRDGTFMMIDANKIYRLTILNGAGVLYEFFTETQPGQEGDGVNMAGLAVTDFIANPDLLYMYDVGEEDDIYTYAYNYDPAVKLTRQTLISDLIPSYNAGRGDLAAVPVTPLEPYPMTQWKAAQGGNGHWYQAVRVLGGIFWHEARDVAYSRGGYLATIHSEAENNFTYALINGDADLWYFDGWGSGIGPWIGGYELGEGTWYWITAEGWTFAAWASGEPNNLGGNEAFAHFFSNTGSLMNNTWNDIGAEVLVHGYIIEWSRPAGPYSLTHFAQLASAWQSADSDLTWNPTWDMNDDGSIDLSDLIEFSLNWLE